MPVPPIDEEEEEEEQDAKFTGERDGRERTGERGREFHVTSPKETGNQGDGRRKSEGTGGREDATFHVTWPEEDWREGTRARERGDGRGPEGGRERKEGCCSLAFIFTAPWCPWPS